MGPDGDGIELGEYVANAVTRALDEVGVPPEQRVAWHIWAVLYVFNEAGLLAPLLAPLFESRVDTGNGER